MNKQRLILIGIFVVTFVIGIGAILISNLITAPKSQNTTSQNTNQIPTLTSYALTCSSISSNTSLTLIWSAPSSLPSADVVTGQITDISSQSQPFTIPSTPVSQGAYVFTQANGVDTYSATLWIQDNSQNRSTEVSTNEINSSQCTSGTQPTPSVAVASASPTPTATSTTAPTQTSTPTPTKIKSTTTVTQTAIPTTIPTTSATLACNTFTLTQNGTTLTSDTISPGSATITIQPGITGSGTISYTNAIWSINPSTPALTISPSQSSATWTPPTNTSGGSTYSISLSGVTDQKGDTLSTPCSIVLTLSTSLPNTASSTPIVFLLVLGLITSITGAYIFFK